MPYDGCSPIAVMQKVAHENLRVSVSLNHPLRDISMMCLNETPKQRPSFDALEKMLRAMVTEIHPIE